MTAKKVPLPPPRRGAPRVPAAEKMRNRSIGLNDRQSEKLDRLGGSAWVRMMIDSAKETKA